MPRPKSRPGHSGGPSRPTSHRPSPLRLPHPCDVMQGALGRATRRPGAPTNASSGRAREAGANRCRAEFSLWECGSSSPATFPAPFGCQHAKNARLSTNATHGDRNYAPLAAAPKRRTLTRLPQAVAEQPEIGRLEVNLIYNSIFQIAYRPYEISLNHNISLSDQADIRRGSPIHGVAGIIARRVAGWDTDHAPAPEQLKARLSRSKILSPCMGL